MPARRSLRFLATLVLPLLFLTDVGRAADSSPIGATISTEELGLKVGTQVPRWTLTSASGSNVELTKFAAEQKNKNLLLVFFRTGTCGVCVSYLVDMLAQLDKMTQAKTSVLAVSLDDAIIQTRTSERLGGKIPLFLDPDARLVNHFGVFNPDDKLARPSVFLIGADRRIKYKYVGRSLVDRPTMETLVAMVQEHAAPARPKRATSSTTTTGTTTSRK